MKIIPNALWRSFKSGILVSVLLLIVAALVGGIQSFFMPIATAVSENKVIQFIVIIGLITICGAVYRLLKRRKVLFLDFLPTAALEKPEVAWETSPGSRRYQTGILLEIRGEVFADSHVFMARVLVAQAGPTSVGGLSIVLVPQREVFLTGRHGGEVFAELMTLGSRLNGK